ncbi:uncharacterized protein LOC123559456 isoform X2 [Mercenaria mercenaria]|uniref:uncharacterized protein LOC123559456 isoform X2 n=1 Tax=Mercenaria mercenaria TaxID=6596 RepID=UPI00234E7AB1|nr:uncharacterized protein LOC123559456 isoform X2 [Mercenaria mercenaria]
MFSIVLLLGFMSIESCQATFYVSTRKSLWNGSDKECMPATPKVGAAIHYSPNAYTVDNLDIDLPDNEEIWVGYYQVEKVFEYIGCVQYSQMFPSTQPRAVTINGDPGHCFPGCGDNIIVGVTKTKCYCLGDEFKFQRRRTEKECIHKCNHPVVACGKDNDSMRYTYLSIYKINDNVSSISETPNTSNKTREMNCLNVMPSPPNTFYWDRCTLSHHFMCYPDMSVEGQRCKRRNKLCSWIEAANACFEMRRFPTLYNNSKNIANRRSGSQLWTGIFKTNVTYKRNEDIMAAHAKIQYGYLKNISDNEVHLKFTEADSKKRNLCLKDENMTTDASSSPTTSRSNTSDTDEDGSGIYIGVGVTLAIILLAAVIIVLKLFFNRRRENQSRTCKRHVNNAGRHEYNYPEFAIPSTTQVENKAPGDENVSYSTIKESNVYDTTETSHDYEKVKTENVYNYPDTGRNTTYDLALGGNGGKAAISKGKVLEDTYDTSKEVTRCIVTDGHTDNVYNKVGDTDNNEYSHLGEEKRQPTTDNLYGYQRRISENGSVNGGGI